MPSEGKERRICICKANCQVPYSYKFSLSPGKASGIRGPWAVFFFKFPMERKKRSRILKKKLLVCSFPNLHLGNKIRIYF